MACGALFDARVDNGNELASVLNGLNSDYLIFLTTVGCPADSASQYSSTLGGAIQNIGGMQYTLDYLTTAANTCGYSLVTVNDGNHQFFTSNAALSAAQFSANGHAGALQGYLAADRTGLLDVAQKAQMLKNSNGEFSNAVDYTFENLSSQQRSDWPLTDTPGHLAAYHDISYQLLTDSNVNESGSKLFDLRFFYTGVGGPIDTVTGLVDSRLSSKATNPVTKSSWDTATDTEFNDVRSQLTNELPYLAHARGYLIDGVRNTLTADQSAILGAASSVASNIAEDETKAANQTVNSNTANWMNFAAGILSVGAALASFDNPATASLLGGVSGMFWSGSAASVPLTPTPNPGPNTPYDMLLSQLTTAAANYPTKLLSAYDGATDNILSDGSKINTAGYLASNSDSGWNLTNLASTDKLAAVVTAGAKASLWMQVLPQLYGLRVALSKDSKDPATFGSKVFDNYSQKYYCASVYSASTSGTVPATSMVADYHIGDNATAKWDVNIIAENTTPQTGGNAHDYAMSSNLSTFLTTSQTVGMKSGDQVGLNIPAMMLIKNGPMTYATISLYNPSSTCDASN